MNKNRAIKYFLSIAKISAENSTCKRLQVGCVLANLHNILISTGYNGAPSGFPHCCDREDDPPPGGCDCVHAEQNAVLWAKSNPLEHKICYVTISPCLQCSKMLAAFGVKEVYYIDKYRTHDSEVAPFFKKAGILCKQIDLEKACFQS